MAHPLQCRCGTLAGEVNEPGKGGRGVCYCKDCQAFAHFLGNADRILDDMGGTDVVATLPKRIRFTRGTDALACMSLTEGGLLRWYAGCCRTPIGNTMRDYRFPYVGLVHTCLGSQAEIEASFGPVRMRVNRQGAKGHPSSMLMSQVLALARFIPSVVVSGIDGSYKKTPFFTPEGMPVVERKVLTSRELDAARSAI